MDEIPKIKPEITFISENEDIYNLLCDRLKDMEFDGSVLKICARKKFLNISIEYRDYVRKWYLEEVMSEFMSYFPFWNDDGFIEFVLQNKIEVRMCIVIYQYGTYPGMSIDHNVLSLLSKFNGDLDFDIY
ncbi:MAG: hypothetical protein J1F71_01090 [Clostridiales bacterium]|nr:hypothetical protein [Clostridiales bacterium]